MKVPFARSAFAEIAGYNTWDDIGVLKALHFKGIGSASGLRDLRRQWGRDGLLLSLYE